MQQNDCYKFCWLNLFIGSILGVLALGQPAKAELKKNQINTNNNQLNVDKSRIVSRSAKDLFALEEAEVQRKFTTSYLIAQGVTRVTGVELNQTDSGLEIIFKTVAGSQKLVPLILPEENKLVIDLLDATLATENELREINPAPGIAEINIIKIDESSIRLTITGEKQTPQAEVVPDSNLVLNVTSQETMRGQTPDEEIEIIATGEAETDNYYVPEASSATRTDAEIRDIPQSVQIIPQRIIKDQQITGIEEVVDNVSGVTFLGDNDGRGLNFAIRGFDNAPVLRDGFRLYGSDYSEPEVANLEQIEILKGPASILYGQVEPGGIVNLVSKQPLAEPNYDLQLQLGNRSLISPAIDFSAPLTEDKSVSYRLNAVYRNYESFRDYDRNFERFFIAPTVAIKDKNTDITFNLEYAQDDNPADFGTLAFGNGVVDIPAERITNNPDDTVEKTYLSFGYNLEHRFNDKWKLRNSFRFLNDRFDYSVLALPFTLDERTGILERGWADQFEEASSLNLYTNVEGKFKTGSVQHSLLFGIDLSRGNADGVTNFDFETSVPLDVFNPDYDALAKPDADNLTPLFDNDLQSDRLGIYLQDKIDLLDNLILLAGVRYDTVEQTLNNNIEATETIQEDDAVSPRLGLVYQPIEPISLYASYSESFNPSEDVVEGGTFLEAETGQGFEAGIKGEIIPNRLAATVAYFDITKQNVATEDPVDPFATIATGEQQSQGVELDLTGEILPGWNVFASYAYIDAEVTEDTIVENIGNKLAGVPEHSASLWTSYELQQGSLKGLGIGAGFNFVGERQGDLDNSFQVDNYFLTNASLFYRRDNWQANLNFSNLFDVEFIESVGNSRERGIYPGEPLTIRGSIAVQF
jgi:iron complex outermembrane recepter protein